MYVGISTTHRKDFTGLRTNEWQNSKWVAQFLIFPKQRMAMGHHQIAKIQIGEWQVKILFLANPNAY